MKKTPKSKAVKAWAIKHSGRIDACFVSGQKSLLDMYRDSDDPTEKIIRVIIREVPRGRKKS